jgi:hypothetical protein
MAKLVSELIFEINANTAAFKSALEETKGKLTNLSTGLKEIGGAIAGAFAVGSIIAAGKAAFDFINRIGDATAKVRDLTNLTGNDLTNVTASIKATSDTFGTDFNETLKTTNALANNYGISFEEASTLVQQGIALQDDDAGQLLGLIKQFSPSFKTLGLDAKQSFAIVSQAMDSGIIPETAIGAIGKATQNLREMNANAQKALQNIGINSDELSLRIKNGSMTEYEAIQKIAEKMKGFGANSKEVGDTLMQVFGKQGVQAGAKFIESLSTMTTKWSEVINNADDVEKSNLRIAEAQTEMNKELVQLFGQSSTYFASIKADAYEIAVKAFKQMKQSIMEVVDYFVDLYQRSILFRAIIQDTIFAFKELWTAIKLVGNLIFDVFGTTGELIKAVFTGNLKAIPNIYASAMKKVATDAINFGKETATNFKTAIENTLLAKKINLIDPNAASTDGKKAGTKAGLTFSNAFGEAVKDKKGNKQGEKNDLGIKVDLSKQIKDFTQLNTVIVGAGKNAAYMPSILQKIGDAFKTNVQQTAYPAMQQLGKQIGESVATGKASFAELGNQVLSTVKQMIAANLAEALSETIAANAALPFPLDVAAIAAGTAGIYAAFSAIPGFANGGVTTGGLAMVGERGAELIDLPAGSRVYNNGDTNKMLSGFGNNKIKLSVSSVGVKNDHIWFAFQEANRKRGNTNY